LVEVGKAQLDMQDLNGWTALRNAARGGRLESVKYLVAQGCTIDHQNPNGETALDIAVIAGRRDHPGCNHSGVVQFLTAASHLTAANDYLGLRALCTPYSSPFLSRKIAEIAAPLRYATILAARHARRLMDENGDAAPVLPLLRRIALVPSADNSSPSTESQVFGRIISFVGAGFDYVEVDGEQQVALAMRNAVSHAVVPLQQDIAALTETNTALTETNAALQQTIADLKAALGGGASAC
jgi:ankyrin repeat protein